MSQYLEIWKKKTYKVRLRLLLWSAVPIMLLCYVIALKKTSTLVGEFRKNSKQAKLMQLRNDSASVHELKIEIVDAWKSQYMLDSADRDANLITVVSRACDQSGIQFREYKPLSINSQHVWTRLFTVNGEFSRILGLIYQLEQVNKICRIVSVQFKKNKADERGEETLDCTLYVQNFLSVN